MRIDNAAYPVIPQYIQEIRPDNNEENTGQHEPLRNPPALQYKAIALLKRKDQASGNRGILVDLSSLDRRKSIQTPTVESPVYDHSRSLFQDADQYFTMVQAAYNSLNRNNHKGLFVDMRI
jgi:hypothetical protein